jgi:hypothetical protein
MCADCRRAFGLLVGEGLTDEDAMHVLWEETAFPLADGATVLRQTKELIERRAPPGDTSKGGAP